MSMWELVLLLMALGVNSASDSLGILMYGEEMLLQYSNNYLKTPPTPANSLFLESFVFLRKKCNDAGCPWAISQSAIPEVQHGPIWIVHVQWWEEEIRREPKRFWSWRPCDSCESHQQCECWEILEAYVWGIFPNDPLSFINMKVWFYNFESKEWQHSQLWEFDQQAEGKKEEERSTGEQKTQEGHGSPSSAFLGNFGDNFDNTTSDEWLKMKRIDPY